MKISSAKSKNAPARHVAAKNMLLNLGGHSIWQQRHTFKQLFFSFSWDFTLSSGSHSACLSGLAVLVTYHLSAYTLPISGYRLRNTSRCCCRHYSLQLQHSPDLTTWRANKNQLLRHAVLGMRLFWTLTYLGAVFWSFYITHRMEAGNRLNMWTDCSGEKNTI